MKHTTAIPYTLGNEVVATEKIILNTWINITAKLKDTSQSIREALQEGLIGNDSEIVIDRADASNAINNITFTFMDDTEQCYEICSNFEIEYDASTNEISFPLFYTMKLDGQLTQEQAQEQAYGRLQAIKQLNDIAICIPLFSFSMNEYKRVNLDIVELIHEMDVAAQC